MLASKRRHILVPWLSCLATIGLIINVVSVIGCYQRTVAPSVKYNDDDARLLEKELEKMDWE